jgi:hypothetical protein
MFPPHSPELRDSIAGKWTLFQYWDSPDPPTDVAGWMAHMGANNPEFTHAVFDEARARAFIAAHYGPREVAAFDACAVPAMQADYFRLCALESSGGLYIDADTQSLDPIAGLLKRTPKAFLYTFFGLINNAILFFPEPHDPFLRGCLTLATDNIAERRFHSVFSAAGPGVFNAVRFLLEPGAVDETLETWSGELRPLHRALGMTEEQLRSWELRHVLLRARDIIAVTPELEDSFRNISRFDSLTSLAPWFGNAQPSYKKTARHWLHWPGSIYR